MTTQTLDQRELTVVDRVAKQLLVDGQWLPARDGRTLDVEDPSTGTALCQVPDASV